MAAKKPLDLLREFLIEHDCLKALGILEGDVTALKKLLTLKSVKDFMNDPEQTVLTQEASNRTQSPRSRG